jgi:hypothetical protein
MDKRKPLEREWGGERENEKYEYQGGFRDLNTAP